MMENIDFFNTHKYLHLKNFLDKPNCDVLTSVLFQYIKLNQTTKDSQCPRSQAIYGAPIFDSLLQQLQPFFESASGKKLLPTYSYARMYSPGEELLIHTDRESCEISATITLGLIGEIWPIYFSSNSEKNNAACIEMEIGDAVLYRGIEKYHWRDKYQQGLWQAQLFLHYVDADGDNSRLKFDGRESLGVTKQQIEPNSSFLSHDNRCWIFDNYLKGSECDSVVYAYNQFVYEHSISKIAKSSVDGVYQASNQVRTMCEDFEARICTAGRVANFQAWQFNILNGVQTEYFEHSVDGIYTVNTTDNLKIINNQKNNTLVIVAFLNDDFTGGDFFLSIDSDKYYPPQQKGSVVVFASDVPYGIDKIYDGKRCISVTRLNVGSLQDYPQ